MGRDEKSTMAGAAERKRAFLAQCFAMSATEKGVIDHLSDYATTKKLRKGQLLFRRGDPASAIYGILQGSVRVYTEGNGSREILLNVLNAGALLGEIGLFGELPRTASVAALEDSELLVFSRANFLEAVRREPKLGMALMRLLCERLRWSSMLVEDIAFLDLPRRFAKRLLLLADGLGRALPDGGIELRVKLSQSLLASMLAVSREAVNKLMARWREQGVIDMRAGHIVIRDRTTLEALAFL